MDPENRTLLTLKCYDIGSTYDVKYNNVDSIVYLNCHLCLNDTMNSNKMFENVLIKNAFRTRHGCVNNSTWSIKSLVRVLYPLYPVHGP